MTVASLELSETNGATVVTDGITNLNYVSVDTPNASSSANPITAGQNSYEKYIRIHLIAINDSNQVDNFQIWMTPSATTTGISYYANLKTAPTNNDTYATPVTTTSTKATLAMPTSDPGSYNLGVGGASTALTTNNTYSDYFISQLRTTGSTPPGNLPQKTIHVQYDEQ